VTFVLASVRGEIANYVDVLAWVYTVTIILYILTQWIFASGLRIPYSRVSNALLTFLHDVCVPFLRIFRRILPSFGGLDFSPIVAIIVVQVAGRLIASAIRG
jgi:YggT family protein